MKCPHCGYVLEDEEFEEDPIRRLEMILNQQSDGDFIGTTLTSVTT